MTPSIETNEDNTSILQILFQQRKLTQYYVHDCDLLFFKQYILNVWHQFQMFDAEIYTFE